MTDFRSMLPNGFFGDGRNGPVSIRSNNPGAINGAPWETNYPGFVGNVKYDGRNDTTVFETPEYGVAAWWELLKRYRNMYNMKTVSEIIRTYGGGQDYSNYANAVEQWTGLDGDYEIVLDGSDDENLLKFAKAMFRYEAGQPTPLHDEQILYGFKMGRNGGRVPTDIEVPAASHSALTDAELAARVVRAMAAKGIYVDNAKGAQNIVYVEGMNLDGTPNNNRIDKWNDLRMVIGFDEAGAAKMLFKCEATTEPGIYYDRVNVIGGPEGAALIALGQQRCWQVGWHSPGGGQEALVQTGGAVSVYRDFDKSFRRQEGHITTGWYGINQHGTRPGYDGDPSTIGPWSAGCLVARRWADHKAFMAIVKADPNYLADHKYVFATTVLESNDVLAVPVESVVVASSAPPPAPGYLARVMSWLSSRGLPWKAKRASGSLRRSGEGSSVWQRLPQVGSATPSLLRIRQR